MTMQTTLRRLVASTGALLFLASPLLVGCSADDADLVFGDATLEKADYDFTIPAGTGLRIDAGELVEILPGRLDVKVGEIIHIANNDDRGHLVGPFFVGAHEQLSQRFQSPGELVGECSVHPSGELIVSVTL